MNPTPPRLPTATVARLTEHGRVDSQGCWCHTYDAAMATELLALRAAGDALAGVVDKTVPWVTLHRQQGFPAQPAREVTAREWDALEDAARAWRTVRGDG